MPIRIETDQTLTFETEQPVTMKTEGGRTIVTIEGATPTPAEPAAEPQQPSRATGPRCGEFMIRSGQPCARRLDHNGVHMNAEQVARKQRYNKRRARERYATDPDYADRVKAQVRKSAQKGSTTTT